MSGKAPMGEDHEPRVCPACGTVNPWMNEVCRDCGEDLDAEPPPPPERISTERSPASGGDSKTTPSKPRDTKQLSGWNARWILIGGALFTLLFMGGEKLIEHFIVANDPILKQLIEEQLEKQTPRNGEPGQELSEGDKQRLRSALMANKPLVLAGLCLFVLTPLLVGGVVGYFSAAVRNGAVGCGLGTVAVMLMSGQVLYGLVFGLLYAGLGALGALAGRHLRRIR